MFPGQRTDLAVDSLQQTWEKSYQSTIILFTHLSTHLLTLHSSIYLSIHPFIFMHPIIYTSSIIPKADIILSKNLVETSFSFVSQQLIGYFYVMVALKSRHSGWPDFYLHELYFGAIHVIYIYTCMFEKKTKRNYNQ